MIRTYLLLTALILLQLSLFSQRVIEVSYTQDSKGNLIFTCNNREDQVALTDLHL